MSASLAHVPTPAYVQTGWLDSLVNVPSLTLVLLVTLYHVMTFHVRTKATVLICLLHLVTRAGVQRAIQVICYH